MFSNKLTFTQKPVTDVLLIVAPNRKQPINLSTGERLNKLAHPFHGTLLSNERGTCDNSEESLGSYAQWLGKKPILKCYILAGSISIAFLK